MNFTSYKDFFQSKLFRKILCWIAGLVAALTIFQAGIFVGYRKASFSYRFGDNYHRTFGSPSRRGMMGSDDFFGFARNEFTSGYGATGTVIRVTLPEIIVEGSDKVEKVITVTGQTIVRRFRDDIKVADLKVGDSIVVIGSPNSTAQIEARLIRILPAGMFNGSKVSTTTQSN